MVAVVYNRSVHLFSFSVKVYKLPPQACNSNGKKLLYCNAIFLSNKPLNLSITQYIFSFEISPKYHLPTQILYFVKGCTLNWWVVSDQNCFN